MSVGGGYASAFLTTVLKSKESEERKPGNILTRTENTEDAATFV
jgi:hypothetical protein